MMTIVLSSDINHSWQILANTLVAIALVVAFSSSSELSRQMHSARAIVSTPAVTPRPSILVVAEVIARVNKQNFLAFLLAH